MTISAEGDLSEPWFEQKLHIIFIKRTLDNHLHFFN